MYGVLLKDGTIVPREDIKEITQVWVDHFAQYGETLISIQNIGTDESPIWEQCEHIPTEKELLKQLEDIDEQTIRPLRAILSEDYTQDDLTKLKALNAKANDIRKQLPGDNHE